MTGTRGAAVLVVGLAGMLLALAGISAWQGTSRLRDRGGERAQVEAAARAFVKAYGSFDTRDPGGYRDRLLALSIGSLRDILAGSEVDPVAVAQNRTVRTWVTSVEVTALSGGQATASLTTEQERTDIDPASGHQRAELVRQQVTCRLTRVDGRWLVAEYRLLSEHRQGPGTGS
jgi:hypothetical protein